MKVLYILILIPILAISQGKGKRFSLPNGIQRQQYASTHVLVKLKKEHRLLLDGQSGASILKKFSASAKPMIPPSLQARSKNRMAPRMPSSAIDISLFYEIYFTGDDIESLISKLYDTGYFELIEPDYSAQLHYTPADPQNVFQYYLDKIRAYEGWEITKGSTDIVIGIVDSGGDLDHPDLAGQLYIDPKEPIDNIDNDSDGFIDNNRGWDFMGNDTLNINNPNFPGDNDPTNPNGGLGSHGTAVAGCAAGATDNNFGISGVGFKSKLLFTKHAADNQGANKGGIYRGYSGILYAATHGAKIINCSWGGPFRSQIQQDLITHVSLDLGCLVVASAGNDGSTEPMYPASYDHVLSVAASDENDGKASFSNFGKTVDIIAPGKGIFTTFFDNVFNTVDGTSFSSPIVAGAAALVWAHNPTFTSTMVGEQLRVTADETVYQKNSALSANKLGKGRLDVAAALTKSFPSIRASNPKLVNASGTIAEPGQEGFLSMDFTNFLSVSSPALTITVTNAQSGPVTISNGIIKPGILATNQKVNNKLNPVSMKINATVPTNTVVELILTFQDGDYRDYQYLSFLLNPSFLDVDDNAVLTTLASNGRIGYEDANNQVNGSGFVFNDNKLLFEMGLIMGSSTSNLLNNVRGTGNAFDQDFSIDQKIKEISPGERSFAEIFGVISDINTSKTVSIKYRSLVWKETPYDRFVILEYKVKNISAQPLTNFHFALFADWDITDNGGGDVAKWDGANQMGYVHPAQADDKPYAGIKILKGASPQYYAIDNNQNTAGTPFGLYDGFTDTEKFSTISSGIGRENSGQTTAKGNDVSHVVGAGPYNINPQEEVTITFALLAGVNFNELKIAAAQSDTVYNLMLQAERPTVADANACFGFPASLAAAGASNLNWYKDFTGGKPFHSGNSFVTDSLFSDTVFYVSNADNKYESVRVPASVFLKANPNLFSTGSGVICDGTTMTLSVAKADQYLWSNGETSQSINVKLPGFYSVKVKDNALVCNSNSKNFQVLVNPSPTAKFEVEGNLLESRPIAFLNSSVGATKYSWAFGDGKTSTAKDPTHTFLEVKEYTVTLITTNDFGCTSSSSKVISIITGLEGSKHTGVLVSPNPFRETVTLESNWPQLEWQLSDMQGKVIITGSHKTGNPFYHQQLLLNELAAGVYLFRFTNAERSVVLKLLKH